MPRQVSPGPFLITTAPSLITCRRCKQPVLAATVGGMDVHVDTATLNDVGELAALIEGRTTYELVTADYLVRRSTHHISAGPAKHPVLATHSCAPTPEHHVNHAWTLAAQALLSTALGLTVSPDGASDDDPPY